MFSCIGTGITDFKMFQAFSRRFSGGIHALKSALTGNWRKKRTGDDSLLDTIKTAGYSYDSKQDIFYSNMDAWQRKVGYFHLYDEAAAPMGIIIDCEPILFEYSGRRWMIEFWKGQYDLNTGCEIGVYSTKQPDIDIPNIFKGPFYNCVSDADRLQMSFSLEKKGKTLFTREERHWWLTGFKVGEFSQPSELTMNLSISLKDEVMRNAFVKGLKNAGYSESEIIINGNAVSLKFMRTHTPQPSTRTQETDLVIQMKNKLLCGKYNEITAPYDNSLDKIRSVKEQSPELYERIINMGKSKKMFEIYEKISSYLG